MTRGNLKRATKAEQLEKTQDPFDTNALRRALNLGLVDEAELQEKLNMADRKDILSKHQYAIREGKDGKWYTQLPDPTKKDKRRKVKRNTRRELEDVVIEYWKDEIDNPTVMDVYREWNESRVSWGDILPSTADRNDRYVAQCKSDFWDMPIKEVTEKIVFDFVKSAPRNYNLTYKDFSSLKTIVTGTFDQAKYQKLTNIPIHSIMNEAKAPKHTIKKPMKKTVEELSFSREEIQKILTYLDENPNPHTLAIKLDCKAGLRPGEVVVLTPQDIGTDYVNVDKIETKYKDRTTGKTIREVKDGSKTPKGNRKVCVNDLELLDTLRQLNPDGEFLFMNGNERINEDALDSKFRTFQRRLKMKVRSLGKLRKTYATMLKENGVTDDVIIEQMGHVEINTTNKHYIQRRVTDQRVREELQRVQGL